MNDRAAVKSPENPGFKPKTVRQAKNGEAQNDVGLVAGQTGDSGRNIPRFLRNRVITDKNRRKLRGLRLTAAAFGESVPDLSG
jgi:hypothetical protein